MLKALDRTLNEADNNLNAAPSLEARIKIGLTKPSHSTRRGRSDL